MIKPVLDPVLPRGPAVYDRPPDRRIPRVWLIIVFLLAAFAGLQWYFHL